MKPKPLTWDDIADEYDKTHKRKARTYPMEKLWDWAAAQPEVFMVSQSGEMYRVADFANLDNSKEPVKTAHIIASGYEWVCPECGWFNTEIELLEYFICPKCKQTVFGADAEHAYG